MNDYIRRSDAVEVAKKMLGDLGEKVAVEINCLTGYVPTADIPTIKQTDALVIADALRYLALDKERNLEDRVRADVLREQILQYGASMCRPQTD